MLTMSSVLMNWIIFSANSPRCSAVIQSIWKKNSPIFQKKTLYFPIRFQIVCSLFLSGQKICIPASASLHTHIIYMRILLGHFFETFLNSPLTTWNVSVDDFNEITLKIIWIAIVTDWVIFVHDSCLKKVFFGQSFS